MNLYSALLCIVKQPKSFTIMGVSPQPPPVCSIHLDDATAVTGQRRQYTHHTPSTGVSSLYCYPQSHTTLYHKMAEHLWAIHATVNES